MKIVNNILKLWFIKCKSVFLRLRGRQWLKDFVRGLRDAL